MNTGVRYFLNLNTGIPGYTGIAIFCHFFDIFDNFLTFLSFFSKNLISVSSKLFPTCISISPICIKICNKHDYTQSYCHFSNIFDRFRQFLPFFRHFLETFSVENHEKHTPVSRYYIANTGPVFGPKKGPVSRYSVYRY